MVAKKPNKTAETGKRKKSSTELIFGGEVMSHGYTGVPNIMVRAQSRLGVNAAQFNLLVQLLSYYMDPLRPPFPTKRQLRERTGLSDATIKKHMKALEQAAIFVVNNRQRRQVILAQTFITLMGWSKS